MNSNLRIKTLSYYYKFINLKTLLLKGFKIILVWDKLPSVNKMYMRTKVGIALSPGAREFKKEVSKQVRAQLPKTLPFTNKDVFKLSLQFVLKQRFFVRDTSNMVKIVEDCIFEELDINDARVLELSAVKSFFEKGDKEYVIATVELSNFDYMYFNKDTKETKSTKKKSDKKIYTQKDLDERIEKSILKVLNLGLEDLEKFRTNRANNEVPKELLE